MRNPFSSRGPGLRAASATRSFARIAWNLALLGLTAFSLLLLALRFFILPKIEDYRPEIVARLSAALEHPVAMGALKAGWDGWNPTLEMSELKVLGADGAALLTLPEVSATVSWQSLFVFDLRLKALAVVKPQLMIRRDSAGKLSVGGLQIDPDKPPQDASFGDWLLRQRRVEIRDALLVWQDDYRQAPQLLLDRVNFRLENHFGRHRFGLTGMPPQEIAAPIDLRGDFAGDSFADWAGMKGRFYARLDYADVATWREWLPLPAQFARGEGALRLWFGFAEGEAREFTADLELRAVAGQLAEGLAPISLDRLSGRMSWRGDANRQEVSTRQLVIQAAGGVASEPADFDLRLSRSKGEWSGGDLAINAVDIDALRTLADHLPLPADLRQVLLERSPRGRLRDSKVSWRGSLAAPELAAISGDFVGLGLASARGEPGFSGLSGHIEGDQSHGRLKLASTKAALELPKVFADPVSLDKLEGSLGWQRQGTQLQVKIEGLEFANAHAAGNASGEYRTLANGPGWIDLNGRLTRGDARFVYAYLPLSVKASVRDYLKRALLGGNSSDTRLTLRGDLSRFPFNGGKDGLFEIRVKGEGASMDYVAGWPTIQKARAELLFRGSRMEIQSPQAEIMGVKLSGVTVTIPDLAAESPVLSVNGEAFGATADFLRYVEESPVLDMIDRFTEGARAAGNAKLNLKLDIPLSLPRKTRVAGELSFFGNRLELADGVPPLEQMNGRLLFSEHELRSEALKATVLGGPAQANVTSLDGAVRIAAQGEAMLEQLRQVYSLAPLRDVTGRSEWQAEVKVRGGKAQWSLDSNLRGAELNLPPPFAKPAAELLPLHLESRGLDKGRLTFLATLGRRADFQLLRRLDEKSGHYRFDRAFLHFGDGAADLARPGFWVRGELAAIDVDRWLAYATTVESATTGSDEGWPGWHDLASLDLNLGALTVLDRRFEAMHVTAAAKGGQISANISGKEVQGQVSWSQAGAGQPKGRLVARLQRLLLPATLSDPAAAAEKDGRATAEDWPTVDVVADNFSSKGRNLGKLELKASADGTDWRLERLHLANPDGVIDATGRWTMKGRRQETQCKVSLDIKAAGAYLARFGMPDAVKGAATKLAGDLAWNGAPSDLDYASLSGSFKIEVGKGQFTKVEPGLGKLLGVLSLQALPRRLTLDFGDIFSSGFAFDSLGGDVAIEKGVLKSDNLLLEGPAARVEIRGRADLASETQDLMVKVFPDLSYITALGIGIAVNPAAGAMVLLVDKFFRNPLDKLAAFEYQVTGSWSDPQAVRVGAKAAARETPAGSAP